PPRLRPRPRPVKPVWRRVGRGAGIAALALLGLLILAIVGGLVWLHTGKGAQILGTYVAEEARKAIQGDLRVKAIQISGFLRICVDGVDLRDPDGHRVLSADRACVSVQPVALKAHKVILSDAVLERPWIEIAKVPGTAETTLQRAIKPRLPPKPGEGGPFAWVIDVRSLDLRGGTVTIRPELGAEATFALRDLNLGQAHARYSADSAAAAFSVTAQLSAPGEAPIALSLDATLDGTSATGTAGLKSLRLKLGESGLLANGSWDIGRQAGEIQLREIAVLPRDVAVLVPSAPLAGAVRGEATLKSDGKTAGAEIKLQAGGGRVEAKLTTTLEKTPVWDVQLSVDKVDPGALSARAPKGQVTGRLSLHSKGVPRLDEHGV